MLEAKITHIRTLCSSHHTNGLLLAVYLRLRRYCSRTRYLRKKRKNVIDPSSVRPTESHNLLFPCIWCHWFDRRVFTPVSPPPKKRRRLNDKVPLSNLRITYVDHRVHIADCHIPFWFLSPVSTGGIHCGCANPNDCGVGGVLWVVCGPPPTNSFRLRIVMTMTGGNEGEGERAEGEAKA